MNSANTVYAVWGGLSHNKLIALLHTHNNNSISGSVHTESGVMTKTQTEINTNKNTIKEKCVMH